jgi:hypothetical protein
MAILYGKGMGKGYVEGPHQKWQANYDSHITGRRRAVEDELALSEEMLRPSPPLPEAAITFRSRLRLRLRLRPHLLGCRLRCRLR